MIDKDSFFEISQIARAGDNTSVLKRNVIGCPACGANADAN
jgi:hypothetical protein